MNVLYFCTVLHMCFVLAGHASASDLQLLLQRVQSAAPQLTLHLLRDGGQHLLLTQKPHRPMADAASLARISHAVDEVLVPTDEESGCLPAVCSAEGL